MITGKYNLKFDFSMSVGNDILPKDAEEWCENNCNGRWSWHWILNGDNHELFITFEREADLIDFILLKGEKYGKNLCR